MSTPTPEDPREDPNATPGDGTPPVPESPQYGQRLPADGQGAPGSPQYGQNAPEQHGQGPYGQTGSGLPAGYGQPGQPNLPPPSQGYSSQSPYGYGYGQQPVGGAPGFDDTTGAKPTPPKQINAAFWLIMAAGLITLVQGLILLLTPDSVLLDALHQGMAMQGPDAQKQLADAGIDLSSMIMPIKIFGLVFMVIGAGIYALIASFIRKGSNGARITGTVLAAISLLGLFSAGDPLTLITVVLGVAGIVLAWLAPSSLFIKAMRERKRAGIRQ